MSGLPNVAHWRNLLRDSGLDSTAKLVGYTLSTYFNGSLEAHPSRETLARGAGLKDVKAVDRAVRRIQLVGILNVDHTRGRHPNQYRGIVPKAPATTASQRQRGLTKEEIAQPAVDTDEQREQREARERPLETMDHCLRCNAVVRSSELVNGFCSDCKAKDPRGRTDEGTATL